MSTPGCPSDDQLTAYLQGRLSMTEAEALEAHVAVCPQCEKRLETADDLGRVVADAYRQGPLEEDQIVAESEFRQAVEAVQQLPGGSPADATRDYPNSEPRIGQVIAGRYKLLEQIGEGGMGAVYMAQQTEPVKRLVALKVIIAGMDSKAVLARFEAERQALAMMDHPNIARVLDAGAMENGRPFFVMELVKGVPITRFCDERRLTLRQRLELFVPVCQAIQHAHQKGIIHRDIKPSNVLVAMYDDRPVPKVIDFGLAKATGQALTDKTLVTAFGAQPGTVLYMSPEQASPNNLDIDTRSDVFALGVLLYELLTGGTPLDRDAVKRAAALEALRMVREEEPPLPSAKLSSSEALPSIAANRNIDPARLARLVQGELDWVALKALEKDRTRRYETANALARDVQRYLSDEIVEARPPSAGYRLRKFVRRHKGQVIAAGLVLAVLLAGIAGTTIGLIRADAGEKLAGKRLKDVEAEKAKVEAERQVAQAVQDFLQNKLLGQADVRQQADNLLRAGGQVAEANRNVTIRELLDRAAVELVPQRIDAIFPNQPRVQVEILRTVGATYFGIGNYDRAISFLQRSVTSSRKELGLDDTETLSSMNDLGCTYLYAGKLDLALPLLEETYKIFKAKDGSDHADTLTVMNSLALTYEAVGKLDFALPLYKEVLKLRKVKLGAKNPLTLSSMNNLAEAYQTAGKLDLALPLYEETLALMRQTYGTKHPETLKTMNNLASAYVDAGKLVLALPLLEEAVSLMKAILPPHHPDTLTAMNNLAAAYHTAGKPDLALPLTKETFELRKTTLGPGHPDTLTSENNLARAYQFAGKLDLALPLFEEMVKLMRATDPPHPSLPQAMSNLATAYQDAGKLDKSIATCEEAFRLGEARFGRQDPKTLLIMSKLGVIYMDAGRLAEALPLLEEAYRASSRIPSLRTTGRALLECYARAGKREKITSLTKELIAGARSQLPKDSLPLAAELVPLGLSLLRVNAFVEAEPLLREALVVRQKAQPDFWTTFTTKSMLGGALLGQKKIAEAEPLLIAGYEGLKQNEKAIPEAVRAARLTEAIQRLLDLAKAKNKPDDVKKWQAELAGRVLANPPAKKN